MARHNVDFGLAAGGAGGVLLPTTKYAVRRVLGVDDPHVYEHHVCGGRGAKCRPFPQLKPCDYLAHKDEACKHCGGRRFDVLPRTYGPDVVEPRNVVYYLRLRDGVHELMADPVYCVGRRTVDRTPSSRNGGGSNDDGGTSGRTSGGGGGGGTSGGGGGWRSWWDKSYWASPYWRRIVEWDPRAADPDNMLIQLGSDAFQPYTWNAKYSTTAVFFRPSDLPPELAMQQRFVQPLMLLGGTCKLESLHSVMPLLWDELGTLYKDGMTVTPTDRAPHLCRVFLTHVFGDSPALAAIMNTKYPSAAFACPFCMMRGQSVEGAVRFFGYYESVPIHTTWDTLPPPPGYVPPGQPPPVQPAGVYWAARKENVMVHDCSDDPLAGNRIIRAPRYTHAMAVQEHERAEGYLGLNGKGAVPSYEKRANGPVPGACLFTSFLGVYPRVSIVHPHHARLRRGSP